MLGTVQGCGSSTQRKQLCCVCSWLWPLNVTIECEFSCNPGVGRFFYRCWRKCTGRTDFRQVHRNQSKFHQKTQTFSESIMLSKSFWKKRGIINANPSHSYHYTWTRRFTSTPVRSHSTSLCNFKERQCSLCRSR